MIMKRMRSTRACLPPTLPVPRPGQRRVAGNFSRSMYWLRFQPPSWKGPVPTGARHLLSGPTDAGLRGSPSRRSQVRARVFSSRGAGRSRAMTTVLASGGGHRLDGGCHAVGAEFRAAAPGGLRIETALQQTRPRSAEVSGWPFLEVDALAQGEGVGLAVRRDLPAARRAAGRTEPSSFEDRPGPRPRA